MEITNVKVIKRENGRCKGIAELINGVLSELGEEL